jgi:hypothetical protein
MDFVQKMLNNRIQSLEEGERVLEEVKAWATCRRDTLDRLGPCITTVDGEYMDVAMFEDLEDILRGTSKD